MTNKKFPNDCPENCPYFHNVGLSDEQFFFCDLLGVEIHGYDDFAYCPIDIAIPTELT